MPKISFEAIVPLPPVRLIIFDWIRVLCLENATALLLIIEPLLLNDLPIELGDGLVAEPVAVVEHHSVVRVV